MSRFIILDKDNCIFIDRIVNRLNKQYPNFKDYTRDEMVNSLVRGTCNYSALNNQTLEQVVTECKKWRGMKEEYYAKN